MAAYQILKPLFLTDLPLPWEAQEIPRGLLQKYPGAELNESIFCQHPSPQRT